MASAWSLSISATLSPEHEAGALRVAAFLISYYGTENISACDAPAPTITTKDRLAMVTIMVKRTPYVIVDICLRMLKPTELYKVQGIPADYIISHGAEGKPFTKTQQVHMCGNNVSPPPMATLARANDPWQITLQQREAARWNSKAKPLADEELATITGYQIPSKQIQ